MYKANVKFLGSLLNSDYKDVLLFMLKIFVPKEFYIIVYLISLYMCMCEHKYVFIYICIFVSVDGSKNNISSVMNSKNL